MKLSEVQFSHYLGALHMLYSLLLKRSRSLLFTFVQSKKYCNAIGSIGKEDIVKPCNLQFIDNVNESQIETKLKNIFENKMKNGNYPLFSNYAIYEKWLPVRSKSQGI